MNQNEQLQNIVSMIDQFMGNQGGHMNIRVTHSDGIRTENTITDCPQGNLACSTPTLFQGLDGDET